MKRNRTINPPTLKERISLWLMISLGMVYMYLFITALLDTRAVEFPPLFWMLIFVLFFYCAQIIHEWVHYLFITVPDTPTASKIYTVDIFTTFCAGEPYEMIVETLRAIKNITYPHNTYLCDEADDPFLKNLCKELGVHHVTRTNKINAKAGNINNALAQSYGELCVVLDPDHVPFPNFLDPIVAHFDNPEIGFVQIVQAYKNYSGGLIAKGAAQQTFQFYGPIMMTMNKYGTVLAIGANCTFRRAALESIGGHAAGLAEDMHTAMQLHAKGWKSLYVPSVLARGLVPDTLSAYYSQQLKWSRGVFELLVTSYPKLFRKFTWQQKLHYGLIPMHYFSGVIFLINFLIPIISLLFNISPINLNLVNFAILGFPLAMSVILIRHFVQSWVMEDDERGFHVVGGLLMIGTWWMFILGFVYTILRKKVPYIPTPKDGKEDNNWHLSIPNISIILISLFAIYYGLSNDWNPYTLIMSGFALMNCGILGFSVLASRQAHFREFKMRNKLVFNIVKPVSFVKNRFWKARHKVYRSGKSAVLPLAIAIAVLSFSLTDQAMLFKRASRSAVSKPVILRGIFAPAENSGLSSNALIDQYQVASKIKFDIVSYYIAWGDHERCRLPFKELDSTYNNGSVPMITWEPWQSLFENEYTGAQKEQKVFSRILKGDYDDYLDEFSKQIKSLNRPVYIRFAHEADNPFYPWSAAGNNTPQEFKDAWKYVYTYFKQAGAYNAIWVWNPWKPDATEAYFPGKEYVDWIGLTNLNYGDKGESKSWYSMEQLYQPYRKHAIFRSGIPVMLAEMGSLSSIGSQDQWFEQAFTSIRTKYPEIKAFVLFNSKWDNNLIDTVSTAPYDWQIKNIATLTNLIGNSEKDNRQVQMGNLLFESQEQPVSQVRNIRLQPDIKGINYTKGKDWLTDYHKFNRTDVDNDLTEMKRIGINAIRWYGPGIYDQNVLSEAEKQDLNIHYTFWLPSSGTPLLDKGRFNKLSAIILKRVGELKNNKQVKSWNIGNPTFQAMSRSYFKPELLHHQNAYLKWLRELVREIKHVDPSRPVTIDVRADEDLITTTDMLHKLIPEIDCYGIMVTDRSKSTGLIKQLKVDYFFSKIDVDDYLKLSPANTGAFVTNWQDEEKKDFVSFNGIKDNSGKQKYSFHLLANKWKGLKLPEKINTVKILKPAVLMHTNIDATYYALVKRDGKWQFLGADDLLECNWVLVKTDKYRNPISIKSLGKGPSITFKIPKNYENHQLQLYLSNGSYVEIISTVLNTPLY